MEVSLKFMQGFYSNLKDVSGKESSVVLEVQIAFEVVLGEVPAICVQPEVAVGFPYVMPVIGHVFISSSNGMQIEFNAEVEEEHTFVPDGQLPAASGVTAVVYGSPPRLPHTVPIYQSKLRGLP
jgi:hypothetical protein